MLIDRIPKIDSPFSLIAFARLPSISRRVSACFFRYAVRRENDKTLMTIKIIVQLLSTLKAWTRQIYCHWTVRLKPWSPNWKNLSKSLLKMNCHQRKFQSKSISTSDSPIMDNFLRLRGSLLSHAVRSSPRIRTRVGPGQLPGPTQCAQSYTRCMSD
jgi:hypothetical protein